MFITLIIIVIVAFVLYKKFPKTAQNTSENINHIPDQTKQNALKEQGLGVYQDIPLTGTLDITYRDGAGEITTRTIILKKCTVEFDGDVMINAHCLKANDKRSFKLSRILEATDSTTKQTINDVFEWFLQQFSQTPYGKAHLFIKENTDAIEVLFHLARLDVKISKAESKAIYGFMDSLGLEDEDALTIAYKICFNQYYELAASTFTKKLRNIKANKSEIYLTHVLNAAIAITNSNKKPHEDKQFALQKMQKEFNLNVIS